MTLIFGIVAGLIAFAIGGLWYGLIFRDAWIKASGIDTEKMEADRQAGKNGQKEMVISLVIEILTAIFHQNPRHLSPTRSWWHGRDCGPCFIEKLRL